MLVRVQPGTGATAHSLSGAEAKVHDLSAGRVYGMPHTIGSLRLLNVNIPGKTRTRQVDWLLFLPARPAVLEVKGFTTPHSGLPVIPPNGPLRAAGDPRARRHCRTRQAGQGQERVHRASWQRRIHPWPGRRPVRSSCSRSGPSTLSWPPAVLAVTDLVSRRTDRLTEGFAEHLPPPVSRGVRSTPRQPLRPHCALAASLRAEVATFTVRNGIWSKQPLIRRVGNVFPRKSTTPSRADGIRPTSAPRSTVVLV
ncbi:hypothetical protein AB0F52_30150 [Amycolatopsis sp. NPDC024027]|uniref:hypothetical protein n=1 Tax=Amycolatopsis sp. NPDC024027 TaxID=3154327 RepID=UPI0033CF0D3B